MLSMRFKENEFFKNDVLSVKVVYDPDDDEEIIRIEGTEIEWSEGKDPTFMEVKKK